MNAQTPPAISAERFAADYCLRHLMAAHATSPAAAVAVADAFLEATAAAYPDMCPVFGGAQAEADWWAECATDTAVAAMLAACLRRFATRPAMTPTARKRAMAALWQSLPTKDRTAFLNAVDPRA